MTRLEIRTFINAGVTLLTPDTEFNFGNLTDFNAKPGKEYPNILLETIRGSQVSVDLPFNTIPTKSVPILLRICLIDKLDSAPEVYEPLIDTCENTAMRLIYQYNNLIAGYKTLTLKQISIEPFIKTLAADCLTGVTLKFNIESQDKTDFCD